MAKLETGHDVLAAMMADAELCNRRMVLDGCNSGDRRLAANTGNGRRAAFMAQLSRGEWVSRARMARAIGATEANVSVIAGLLYAQGQIERRYAPKPFGPGRTVEWKRKEGGE